MIKLADKLYTSTEVAEILGVSLRSVYRYIDENKLHAEVKTATGRHRFTKHDILNFLYPQGVKETAVDVEGTAKVDLTPAPTKVSVKAGEAPAEAPSKPAEGEESVDWLSKFRSAAKKIQVEEGVEAKDVEPAKAVKVEAKAPVKPAPVIEAAEEVKVSEEPAFAQEAVSGISGIAGEEKAKEPAPAPAKEIGVEKKFYRSALGGLKDIAQKVDKSARGSQVAYAFTLHSGLSLYSPIKPFSVLHVYVGSEDVAFFEEQLQLTTSEEKDAQLCLLVPSDAKVFEERDEMHGLYIVSKKRLAEDIVALGDDSLRAEAEGVLEF